MWLIHLSTAGKENQKRCGRLSIINIVTHYLSNVKWIHLLVFNTLPTQESQISPKRKSNSNNQINLILLFCKFHDVTPFGPLPFFDKKKGGGLTQVTLPRVRLQAEKSPAALAALAAELIKITSRRRRRPPWTVVQIDGVVSTDFWTGGKTETPKKGVWKPQRLRYDIWKKMVFFAVFAV